jgi:hypothetical protein
MADWRMDRPKWRNTHSGPVTQVAYDTIFERLAERIPALIEKHGDWNAVVNDHTEELFSAADAAALDAVMLKALGRKFIAGAEVSVVEYPDRYQWPEVDIGDVAESFETDQVGVGDNVFQHENLTGPLLHIDSVAQVEQLLEDGVPEGTIALIDDSGGTLTAPILGDFYGVICAGGTVRSHLGIISREFRVPCLMNVKMLDLPDGTVVEVEYGAEAQTQEAYQGGESKTARVWKRG